MPHESPLPRWRQPMPSTPKVGGSEESGTCTRCGERMLVTDWQEHRERVHGYRPEPSKET